MIKNYTIITIGIKLASFPGLPIIFDCLLTASDQTGWWKGLETRLGSNHMDEVEAFNFLQLQELLVMVFRRYDY